MSVQISAHIDEATKQQFDKVCGAIGISPSDAIDLFIRDVVNYNGFPYNAADTPKETKAFKMSREDTFGCMRGQFTMADDFDAPLEDFKEYME
jgi:addiction module RelB/DinJ family antitoxin